MNPHTKLASFYRYFYMTEKLPNNLCTYFWGLMLAFILTPLTWLAMLHNRIYNPIKKKTYTYEDKTTYYYDTPYKPVATAFGLGFTLLAFCIGAVTLISFGKLTGIDTRNFIGSSSVILGCIKIYAIGLLTVFGTIALFYLLMAIWRLIPKKEPKKETDEEYYARRKAENKAEMERRIYKENNPTIFTLAWKWLVAFKEKNCPIITWDYTKED